MIGQLTTPTIADEIPKISSIYPPHAADADGPKIAVAFIYEAVYRLRGHVQDFGDVVF
jgi:hypothetical protein